MKVKYIQKFIFPIVTGVYKGELEFLIYVSRLISKSKYYIGSLCSTLKNFPLSVICFEYSSKKKNSTTFLNDILQYKT